MDRADAPITRAEHEEFKRRIEEENGRQDTRLALLETQTKSVESMISEMKQDSTKKEQEIETIMADLKESKAISKSVEKLAVSMEKMLKEQESQGERLSALEGRDGEMWRKVVSHVVTTAIGAIIAFIFASIGMG